MQRKNGVSLIVLSITILVMAILAATAIISLEDSGIIGRSKNTVSKQKETEEHTRLQVIKNGILTDNFGEITVDEYIVELQNRGLIENNITTDEYGSKIVKTKTGLDVYIQQKGESDLRISFEQITTKAEGNEIVPADWKASVREVTEDGVPIPKGFIKSPYAGEGTKTEGLVIYALTSTEVSQGKTTITDSHQTALTTRNQFVWVPVDRDNFETQFIRKDFINATSSISYTLGETNMYWELSLVNNMPSATQNTSYVSSDTLAEATAMYASIKKYGGFYIARYEVGTSTITQDPTYGYIATRATVDNILNMSITMGKYPYSTVAWGTSMSDETSVDKAVSLSRAFYPNNGTNKTGVVSTLIYGVEWDRILDWWKELDAVGNINLTSSTNFGVYEDTLISPSDLNTNAMYSIYENNKFGAWSAISEKTLSGKWLLTTGGYKKAKVYNIYDIGGNLYEWTMEGHSTSNRVVRGGSFVRSGSTYPVAYRSRISPDSVNYFYGFRPALYIK